MFECFRASFTWASKKNAGKTLLQHLNVQEQNKLKDKTKYPKL